MNTKSNTTDYTWTWTTNYNSTSGLNGWLITWNGTKDAAADGTTLFLPAAGYRYDSKFSDQGARGAYWSSSIITSSPYSAWNLNFSSGNVYVSTDNRFYGRSVRAIKRI